MSENENKYIGLDGCFYCKEEIMHNDDCLFLELKAKNRQLKAYKSLVKAKGKEIDRLREMLNKKEKI